MAADGSGDKISASVPRRAVKPREEGRWWWTEGDPPAHDHGGAQSFLKKNALALAPPCDTHASAIHAPHSNHTSTLAHLLQIVWALWALEVVIRR